MAKDYIGVGWSLTQMLLKKAPDAVDVNPVKIAFGLAKIVLQLKEVRSSSAILLASLLLICLIGNG